MSTNRYDQTDYYQILGVLSSASLEEITAAYYALAQLYHPDVSHQDRSSVDEFKRINEAYEVLSDQWKRARYDRVPIRRESSRPRDVSHADTPLRNGAGADGYWPDGSSTMSAKSPTSRISDLHVELPISPEEAALGGPCDFQLTICTPCRECRSAQIRHQGHCDTCGDSGTFRSKRLVNLRIPPGTRDNSLFRLELRGMPPVTTELRTDVVVKIKIKPYW